MEQQLNYKATDTHKLTEQGCRVLKCAKCKNSLSSVASLTTVFQIPSRANISTSTVSQELHEMGFCGHTAAHKPNIIMCNAEHGLEWCSATGPWNSGNMFFGMMNSASLFSSPMNKSGFDRCQENTVYWNYWC